MARHTTTENGVIILLLIFFISLVTCESAGTKLGYKPGTFKDFVSEKTRGIMRVVINMCPPCATVRSKKWRRNPCVISVSLSCRSSDIMVNLNFSVPFRGLVHAGKKDSGCSFRGDGKMSYSLNVPHAACGTIHVTPQDSFANTLTIRYHHALELEGDEIKTILCKYGTGSIQLG